MLDDLSSDAEENLFADVPFYRVDVADAGAVEAAMARVRPRYSCVGCPGASGGNGRATGHMAPAPGVPGPSS